jgi:3-deoxy-7-phosphoheptulonate synthase
MIEVHIDPAHALSDGHQSLTPEVFAELVAAVTPIAESLGRRVSRVPRPASV